MQHLILHFLGHALHTVSYVQFVVVSLFSGAWPIALAAQPSHGSSSMFVCAARIVPPQWAGWLAT